MIHTLTLAFYPKTYEEHMLFKNIIDNNKNIKTMINTTDFILILPDKKWFAITIHDLSEFIGKNNIENKDYSIFERKINRILKKYDLNLDVMYVHELHYKLDLHLPEHIRQEYLYIFSKLRKTYYSTKKKVYRSHSKDIIESVYYNGSQYGFNLNQYDKPIEMFKKGNYKEHLKDVLRIELQLHKGMIKDFCKKNDISRELINFWHTSMRDTFFTDIIINKFLYSGDHYSTSNIHNQLSSIPSSAKEKIISFCNNVKKSDISYAQAQYKSMQTSKKIIQTLQGENINPIPSKTLDKLDGLETILRDIREDIEQIAN